MEPLNDPQETGRDSERPWRTLNDPPLGPCLAEFLHPELGVTVGCWDYAMRKDGVELVPLNALRNGVLYWSPVKHWRFAALQEQP